MYARAMTWCGRPRMLRPDNRRLCLLHPLPCSCCGAGGCAQPGGGPACRTLLERSGMPALCARDHPILPPGSGVDCTKVCNEYNTCKQTSGGPRRAIPATRPFALTNATTGIWWERLAPGLGKCQLSEIIKAETAAECSCCASQLCGCGADGKTNTAIFTLNQQQRDRGITPQCDINGTLCGSP